MAKKTNKTRYYVASECFISEDLPDFIKNLCQREATTYRQTKLLENLTAKEKRDGREKVIRKEKIHMMVSPGKIEEKEKELVSFDRPGWRYYVEFEAVKELNNFFEEIHEKVEIPSIIKYIDPEHCEHCAKAYELDLGIEGVAEGSYFIYFIDSDLMEDEEFEGDFEEGEEDG